MSAGTQGNTQVFSDGGLFVGWGSEGHVTEFSAAGDVVFDATFAPADSYRGYRFEWEGSRPIRRTSWSPPWTIRAATVRAAKLTGTSRLTSST